MDEVEMKEDAPLSFQAGPIPTLFDQDEGCERGFLRGWIESETKLSEEWQTHLLDALDRGRLGTEEFLAQELGEDEAEAIVLQLF